MSSSARAAAASDAPSIGWLLGMSSWMLLTVFPGPILTWLGFSIIGVASRSRRLIILGVVWGAAALLVSFEIWGQWQPLARAIVYLGGMVVALAVNPGWLRTMWQRRLERTGQGNVAARSRPATWHRASATDAGARASDAGETAAAAATAPVKKPSRRSRRQRNAAAAAAAAQRASAEAKAKAAQAKAAESAKPSESAALAAAVGASSNDLVAPGTPAETVDVNTAAAAELEDLPGMNRSRARRAVKEREAQGGFTSLEDFGETVGLQPHEIVRLRRVATCSPRPRGERRFGRRVDY